MATEELQATDATIDALVIESGGLTMGAGTTISINATTFTYGTGSAAAHRTALGLGATGSIAASDPLTVTQTWTDAAVTYTGLQVNVTDTASAAASLLMDLRVGGVSRASVRKDGRIFGDANTALSLSGGFLNFHSFGTTTLTMGARTLTVGLAGTYSGEVSLQSAAGGSSLITSDAADTLAQRRSTNPQESRIYGTYTDTSNYRRLALKMSTAGVAQIVAEGGGTGAADNRLEFVTGGATRMTVAADGNITASGTLTGASGAFGNWTLGADILATTPGGSVQVSGIGSFRFGGAGERIYNSGSAIKIRNAANTLDAALTCSNLTASGTVQTGGYTFDTLPTPTTGMRAYITDGATSPVFMANAAGGGSTVTPVFYNGANWINA
jgi:hypothetical protein